MRKSSLLAAAAAAACSPAFAQAPGSAASTQQARLARDDGGDALPTITVTARRRAEDAQKVPGALSVVGGELLDKSYTVNTQELSLLVPSLNYSSANPRNTAFTIRGLGSSVVAVSQSNDGLEPGVGFYVDQVYHARPATAAFDFADIAQIEVLRGPQGTVFGKNTTAGAISITPRIPTFTPEGEAEISFGSRYFLQAKAAASAPITDTLAFRVSGVSTRSDGYITNVHTREAYNGDGTQAVRGQLLYKPSDPLSIRLTADYTNFSADCCAQVYLRVGTSLRPAARQYPALAAGAGYAVPSTNAYDRVNDIDVDVGSHTSEGGASGIIDYDLGPATITSVSAWRFWQWDAANDRDYIGLPIQLVQHIPSHQDQYSQELRVASNGDHRINYVGGLYFFDQTIRGRPISTYGSAAAYWLLGPAPTYPSNLLTGYTQDGATRFTSNSYAAFGEVNWKPIERLTLTGGLRYTYEKKHGSYTTIAFGGLDTTGNTTLTNAKLSIIRPQSYEARDTDGSVSGRANVSYQFTDGILGYASYARGFKSGGINISGLPLNSANQPVLSTAVIRPERNTTYEVGAKTRLLDQRLILNLAGYYTQVKDFQATIVDSSQTVALRGYLSNIPQVVVKGIEADATLLVTRGLTLRGSLAYAHGKYDQYPAGPCPLELQGATTTACNLTGQRLSGLPSFAETVGADYALPIAHTKASLVFHVDSSWRSGYYGEPSDSAFSWIKGYNVTNGSLGVRLKNGLEVDVWARNLLDADYIQNLTIQAGNSGLILGTPSEPRAIGVTLRARQ